MTKAEGKHNGLVPSSLTKHQLPRQSPVEYGERVFQSERSQFIHLYRWKIADKRLFHPQRKIRINYISIASSELAQAAVITQPLSLPITSDLRRLSKSVMAFSFSLNPKLL